MFDATNKVTRTRHRKRFPKCPWYPAQKTGLKSKHWTDEKSKQDYLRKKDKEKKRRKRKLLKLQRKAGLKQDQSETNLRVKSEINLVQKSETNLMDAWADIVDESSLDQQNDNLASC